MTRASSFLCFVALLSTALPVSPALADTKVRGKYTASGQVWESVVYTKGLRQLYEYENDMAVIEQPDLKRMIQLNRQTKMYFVVPTSKSGNPADTGTAEATPTDSSLSPAGVLKQVTIRTDTGERRNAFGFAARRIKSTVTRAPEPGACATATEKMEIDGWYIDLDDAAAYPGEELPNSAEDICHDRVVTEEKGGARWGYPIHYTIRSTKEENGQTSVTEVTMEVLELAVTRLEESLFEVPADYVEARTYEDLARFYSAVFSRSVTPGQASSTPAPGHGFLGPPATPAAFTSYGNGRYVGTKPKGFFRIGVPAVGNKTKWQVPSATYADHLIMFIDSERKKRVEAVPLEGATAVAQEADARKKECDYVVQAEIADLHRQLPKVKKGMMAMGAGMMPGIGKYEAKLEYRLLVPGQRSPKMASSVVTKSGTAGSGWKTALNVGLTAGSMALAMQGMGGLSPGMLGMYRMSPGLAALGLGRAMRFDPRVVGLSSTLGGMMGGGIRLLSRICG